VARKRWSLVVVPDDGDPVRQWPLNRVLRWLVLAGACALLIAGTVVLVGRWEHREDRARAERLAQRNALLTEEVDALRSRVQELRGAVSVMSAQDERFRSLMGLSSIDPRLLSRALGTGAGMDGPGADLTGEELAALVEQGRALSAGWRAAVGGLAASEERARATPSILPVGGRVAGFLPRPQWHTMLLGVQATEGIDIPAPEGAPAVAAAAGRVARVLRTGEVWLVEVNHGAGFVTRYGHLGRAAVRSGAAVERGELLGWVGRSGHSLGPHLHYEVLHHGRHQDPMDYILEPAIR
jgi:murein DD-endopeptidase MepM/ murein hydrolase activator NlpD